MSCAIVANGKQLGRQFAAVKYDELLELQTLFPALTLLYRHDYAKIKSRLKLQLAMWLGDRYTPERLHASQLLEQQIDRIKDLTAWNHYQRLWQVILAEVKSYGAGIK